MFFKTLATKEASLSKDLDSFIYELTSNIPLCLADMNRIMAANIAA